jgi:hypothetical protein
VAPSDLRELALPLNTAALYAAVMARLMIDELLPTWDVATRHRVEIHAPAAVVYRQVRGLDMSRSWGIRALFRLRGMPSDAGTLEGLQRAGFALLVEQPRRELVLGVIGKFWTSGRPRPTDAEHFRVFSLPGYAKGAWNFVIDEEPDRVVLTTETRVLCLDDTSRQMFRRYWRVIRPFSGWIRQKGLAIVKEESERCSTSS